MRTHPPPPQRHLILIALQLALFHPFLVSSFTPHFRSSTTTTSTTATPPFVLLSTPNGRADVDVVLGSEDANQFKNEEGLYEDDMDDDQLDRIKRRQEVQDLMEEKEELYREERKRKKWGKFANVSKEELAPLLQQEAKKMEKGKWKKERVKKECTG